MDRAASDESGPPALPIEDSAVRNARAVRDIFSFDSASTSRYIEVKTINGAHASSFIISRNELDLSQEVEDAFYLYRLFKFRENPSMYVLLGDISKQLHLEPMDYRASFKKFLA